MTIMKLNVLFSTVLLGAGIAVAQNPVESSSISMVEGMMNVDMDLRLDEYKVKSNQAIVVTPCLVNMADTLWLEPVGVYGRSRYIQHLRGNDFGIGTPATVFRAGKVPENYHYNRQLEWEPWIDGATLDVKVERYGCVACSEGKPELIKGIGMWHSPRLDTKESFAYVQPAVEREKTRQISGRANVEFPVNSVKLLDSFRNNYAELAVVRATVDSVRDDKDVTIRKVSIKGYASPEGSYAVNERLAEGRTLAVVDYVNQLYKFGKGMIHSSWEAEDWNGLRAWVEKSNIENRDGILAVIDSSLAPDAKDRKLATQYPRQYQTLLNTVYPTLRHTDYLIEYVIRSYSDPKEILEVMKKKPGNLSLDEFFIAAQSLEPGSPEFNEVMEIAVRMYPDDPVANLNAANIAIAKKDIPAAEKYLSKAGNSVDATYARGILEMVKGDYDAAQPLLEEAQSKGVKKAARMIEQLEELREFAKVRAAAKAGNARSGK